MLGGNIIRKIEWGLFWIFILCIIGVGIFYFNNSSEIHKNRLQSDITTRLNTAKVAVDELYINDKKDFIKEDISNVQLEAAEELINNIEANNLSEGEIATFNQLKEEYASAKLMYDIKEELLSMFSNYGKKQVREDITIKEAEDLKNKIDSHTSKKFKEKNQEDIAIVFSVIEERSIKAIEVSSNEVSSNESGSNNSDFLNLQKVDSSIVIDLRYATSDNFTGQVIYDFKQAIARNGTAEKLAKANSILKEKGYRIKVWDAYRPTYAQQKLWDVYPDPNFVAKPNPNRSHELGVSLDVTLCDLEGNELNMQSGFDDFSERAHRDYKRTEEQEKYYNDLNEAMLEAGFSGYINEWWHYDDTNKEGYTAMQVDPKEY